MVVYFIDDLSGRGPTGRLKGLRRSGDLAGLEKLLRLIEGDSEGPVEEDMPDVDRDAVMPLPGVQARNVLLLDDDGGQHRRFRETGLALRESLGAHLLSVSGHFGRVPKAVLALDREYGLVQHVLDARVHVAGEWQLLLATDHFHQPLRLSTILAAEHQEVWPLLAGDAGRFQLLEVEFHPLWVFGCYPTRPIGQGEELPCRVDGLDEPLLAPHPLGPAHEEVAAPQHAGVEPKLGPGRLAERPCGKLNVLLGNEQGEFVGMHPCLATFKMLATETAWPPHIPVPPRAYAPRGSASGGGAL